LTSFLHRRQVRRLAGPQRAPEALAWAEPRRRSLEDSVKPLLAHLASLLLVDLAGRPLADLAHKPASLPMVALDNRSSRRRRLALLRRAPLAPSRQLALEHRLACKSNQCFFFKLLKALLGLVQDWADPQELV